MAKMDLVAIKLPRESMAGLARGEDEWSLREVLIRAFPFPQSGNLDYVELAAVPLKDRVEA
jgi:hypothetical protein